MLRQTRLFYLFLIVASGAFANDKLDLTVVDESDGVAYEKNGRLDARSVRQLLWTLIKKTDKLYFLGSILAQADDCINIRQLGEQDKGVHTGQLFSITVRERCLKDGHKSKNPERERPLYILKESKKGLRELRNLHKVRNSPLGELFYSTEERLSDQIQDTGYEMARITFEELHFTIKQGHHHRYFSLLQTAPGRSLQNHLQSFGLRLLSLDEDSEDYVNEVMRMKHIFYRIGFSISKFHQYFSKEKGMLGKSYIHGDLHAQNLFYDDETDDVSLIDNETFSLSLKKRSSGINDIVDLYLLHSVHTVAHYFSNLLINIDLNINDALWHELWQELFFGYLCAYEPLSSAEKLIAYKEFHDKLLSSLSNGRIFHGNIKKNIKDQRMLKRVKPSMRRFYLREHKIHEPLENARNIWVLEQ